MAYNPNLRHVWKLTPFQPLSWLGDLTRRVRGDYSQDTDLTANVLRGVDTLSESMLGKYAGTNLTGQEQAVMQFNADEAQKNRDFQERMSSTTYQRTVQDMKLAGLNPALLLTGASGVSTPSGSTASASPASGGSLSDILSLIMLPLQMQQLQANIDNINANTRNTNARTMTEEQEAQLKALMVQYYPKATDAQIGEMVANMHSAYASAAKLENDADLIKSQEEAQKITNDYLPKKYEAELLKLGNESAKLDEEAKLTHVRKLFEEVQYQFARDNHFLMSQSDSLMVCTYIASLLGLDTKTLSNFIQNDVPRIVRQTVEDSHLGTPGGPHK